MLAPDQARQAAAATAAPMEPCPRCGTYAELADHWTWRLCRPCFERVLHPIETSPATLRNLLWGTGQLIREVGLWAVVIALVFTAPRTLLGWSGYDMGLLDIPLVLLGIVGTATITHMALQRCTGTEKPELRWALARAVTVWGRTIGAFLLSTLIIMLFLLLLVVPGVMRAMDYFIFLPLIVAGDATTVRGALEQSRERMWGYRLNAFGAYLVWMLPLFVYWALNGALLYAEEETALVPRAISHALTQALPLLGTVLEVPITFLAVVLYVKLRDKPPGWMPSPPNAQPAP